MANKHKRSLDPITALDIAQAYLDKARDRMTIKEAVELKKIQIAVEELTIIISNRLR